MSNIEKTEQEFDLQPDPRILPMLGEINLLQWQCMAELIDNSVDGFLSAEDNNELEVEPEVRVSLPTKNVASAQVSVLDNGPGMDAETLENAVRAGWTGHGPVEYLGLFGMGFNVATARLGNVTKVWSTRRESSEWVGLEIDFEKLQRQRHFRTPMLRRGKTDPKASGTEIVIENLKADQREWLAKGSNRAKIRKQLAQVYSAMLRPNGTPITLNLVLNNTKVQGHRHCVWGDPRDGSPPRTSKHARWGEIDAFHRIDRNLGERPFCLECWRWLHQGENICGGCESDENVIDRERKIRGWLGIQRYYDESHYGIDFLRNGRKIEVLNKDLFYWSDGYTKEKEYPIDDPRDRGRIVGEIHIDHCRVTYTKSNFERTDPSWQEMLEVIRGQGPLRPDKAAEQGYAENKSPLFRLFQAFRRNTPKPKKAGCWENLLVVPDNDRARAMAKRYRDGDPEYQSDEKWMKLCNEADEKLLTDDPTGPQGKQDDDDFWDDEDEDDTTDGQDEEETSQDIDRNSIPSLTREYKSLETDQQWDIKAFSVAQDDPALRTEKQKSPWALVRTTAGPHDYFVNEGADVFRSATLTPLDALLAELSWNAMDFLRSSKQDSNATFASVLTDLRSRYASNSQLDPVALKWEADEFLESMASSVAEQVEEGSGTDLYKEFSADERQYITDKIALSGDQAREELIETGGFLEYAPRRSLINFFRDHPELFFDGNFWESPYTDLPEGEGGVSEEVRSSLLDRYTALLHDAIWLAEGDRSDLERASKSQLLRASLAIDLLNTDLTTSSG